jgi:hypothetical protein
MVGGGDANASEDHPQQMAKKMNRRADMSAATP